MVQRVLGDMSNKVAVVDDFYSALVGGDASVPGELVLGVSVRQQRPYMATVWGSIATRVFCL